jgi:uncharacterized protein YndB with AHSA1/START domain
VIRASRQRVFEAWTKPEEIRKWLGPGTISVAEAEMDVRQGGKYRIVMQGAVDGNPEFAERRVVVDGVYKQVVANELVSYTWRPTWSPGEESLVTVRLNDVEGGTEIVLTHERFATMESRESHTRGWNSSLDKLTDHLSK